SPYGALLIAPLYKFAIPYLVVDTERGSVSVRHTFSKQNLVSVRTRRGSAAAAALSVDGRRLVVADPEGPPSGGTVLGIWDLSSVYPTLKVTREQEVLQSLWVELGDTDPRKSWHALCALAQDREQTLQLLEKYLLPIPTRNPAEVVRLVAQLDAERFRLRNKAERELQGLGEQVVPVLREAARKSRASVDATRRMERLLEE